MGCLMSSSCGLYRDRLDCVSDFHLESRDTCSTITDSDPSHYDFSLVEIRRRVLLFGEIFMFVHPQPCDYYAHITL
jgi:hypothetical protein